ncbi:hypothetical protein BTJ68_12466 [Hortaea werneckii EXF-2000]|uniref:DNA-directed RNA polymerase III subunit RPC4 n=1 Tax=Hortaea werneckii EXF-2000 TaxID=1157616 RepID=A0A1Z5SSZ1_HORWE|nr:hypothetical protein BTJ68_12466 [Hortaea werneckii EXF-2000]
MPPKAPAKAPPRRGAASKPPASTSQQPSNDSSTPQQDPPIKPDPDSIQTSTEPAPPSTDAASASATPGHISIASTPAGSAAPSPAPSTSRGASGTPATTAGRGASSQRGRGGKPIIAKPKFAGRRSQAGRAEAEKAEAERKKAELDARAKEEAAKARREGRFRGRGGADGRPHRGRGRGGYVGESERQPKPDAVASGPFSSGQVNQMDLGKRRAMGSSSAGGGSGGFGFGGGGGGWSGGGGSGGGRSGGGSGGRSMGGVKMEPGSGEVELMPQVKQEEGEYISSDEDEAEQGMGRLNIDELGVIDLTVEEEEDPSRGFAPVRLKREEHKERTVGVNVDEAEKDDEKEKQGKDKTSEKRKGKQKQRPKDVEITGESEKYHGAYSSSEDEPVIKAEPTEDDERPDAPPAEAAENESHPQEPPSSPETKRKAKEKIKTGSRSAKAPTRPAYQTQEEIDEWNRQQDDLRILHSELGTLAVPPPQPTDQDGDAAMTDGQQPPVEDKRADKVYLFQFPPVVPDLNPIKVKPDPETAPSGAEGETMDVDNAQGPQIKKDPAPPSPNNPTRPPPPAPRLRRPTLDWGGTALSVAMGTEASFLQDVVIASLPEHKGEVNGEGNGGGGVNEETGVAMAMGQVKGKFVVTPDWGELLR